MDKYEFCSLIVDTMKSNPEWTPDVFKAVFAGTQAAFNVMERRIAEVHAGLLSAMCFVKHGHVPNEIRDFHINALMKAYGHVGMKMAAPAEKEAMRKILNMETTDE